MGKYSDADIDAMLKRIQDNVEKQSANSENEKEDKEPVRADLPNNTPEELIDLIMADIGKNGGSPKRSTELDQYDISGFEIEEPMEDPQNEVSEDFVEAPIDENTDDQQDAEIILTEDMRDTYESNEKVEKSEEDNTEHICVVENETADTVDDELHEELLFEEEPPMEELELIDLPEPIDLFDEMSEKRSEECVEDTEISINDNVDESDIVTVGSEPMNDVPEAEETPSVQEQATTEESEEEIFDTQEFDFSTMSNVTSAFAKKDNLLTNSSASFESYEEAQKQECDELDYSDMNFAMSLGSKDSLESSFGFVKVREAKHNFVNTEKRGSGSNIILDYKKEYRSFDQTAEIKDEYRKEKKHIGKRVVFTAIIFMLITFCEMMNPMSPLPDISEFLSIQLRYNIISLILFVIAVAISAKKLFYGVVGFFTTRSNYYTVIGFVSLVNLLYSLLVLTIFEDRNMVMLNSVTVLGIFIIVVGEYLQIAREIHTFELVSDEKPKISLEKIDISSETIKKASFLESNEFVIENANFVGRYFERSARTPGVYHIRHTFVTLTMLLSLFVAVTAVIVTRDFADFMLAIELSSLLCVPVQFVFLGTYAFYVTSKKLLKLDSAIIGETLADEYVGSNTIYLDDVEAFGKHGAHVVGLDPFNNFNIIDVNYYYLSVFSKVSGPLKNAFGDIPDNINLSDNVELINVYSDGIEALVDEKNKILVGKPNFLRARGIRLGKNAEDRYGDKGDTSVMYLAVNGALCARLYLKYNITHHFEKFAEDMAENGSWVGIRTIDPNITEEMVAGLHGDNIKDIHVMRPTLNDLVPIGRRSDSGIITEKNPHMIARILAEGLKIKKINNTINVLWGIYSIIGIVAVIASLLFGVFDKILPVYIIVYQLIWVTVMLIYTKNKLRNGKSK